jgi:hypothetical protein
MENQVVGQIMSALLGKFAKLPFAAARYLLKDPVFLQVTHLKLQILLILLKHFV